MTSAANPQGGGSEVRLMGAVSAIPTPDRTALAEHTRKVYAVTPYNDSIRLTPGNVPIGSPIPQTVGGSSPIKHVFYIIRENRTYDQILGDIQQGNGDPTLTLFGRSVTANGHALADSFVLFDNFYVDADVSYDGHAFSTAAYATDVIQKMWQTLYANRGGLYLCEGEGFMRTPYGNITAPERGYIWDYAGRAGVTVRSYGEFVTHLSRSPAGDVVAAESVPGLKGSVAPYFAGLTWRLRTTSAPTPGSRSSTSLWRPQSASASIVHLGNDRTMGTTAGTTPRAMIADNDLALGRVVEAISNSPSGRSPRSSSSRTMRRADQTMWTRTARCLVASPFARHGFVDHTFYSTSGVLRTMEMILGLPPMSYYDAAATPLFKRVPGHAQPCRVSPPDPRRAARRKEPFHGVRRVALSIAQLLGRRSHA
jgi:hypothetical protein